MKKTFFLLLFLLIPAILIIGCGQQTPPPPGTPLTPAIPGAPGTPGGPGAPVPPGGPGAPAPVPTPSALNEAEILGGVSHLLKNEKSGFTPDQLIQIKALLDDYGKKAKNLHTVEFTAPAVFGAEQLAYIKNLGKQGSLSDGVKLSVKDSLVETSMALVNKKAVSGDKRSVAPSGSKESMAWHDIMWGSLQLEKKGQLALTGKQAQDLLPYLKMIKESLDTITQTPDQLAKVLSKTQLDQIKKERQNYGASFEKEGGKDAVINNIEKSLGIKK